MIMATVLAVGIALSLLPRGHEAPNPNRGPTAPPTPPPVLYGNLGAQVQLTGYRLTVITANLNAGKALAWDPNAPDDRLVVVRVSYENRGHSSVSVTPYDWLVMDSQGSVYPAAYAGGVTDLPQELLAPGDGVMGRIEFDVTKGARGLTLRYASETGQTSVIVPLS
jgi:hypothetical protein